MVHLQETRIVPQQTRLCVSTFLSKTISASAVRKQLKELTHKINVTIQPIFTSRKLGQDLKPKEKKPDLVNQNCVVYVFKCDLCDADYVGMTTRHLHQRIVEHKHSSIGNHFREHHYSLLGLKSSQFYVLKKCSSKFNCLGYEMLFIRKLKPSLNVQSSSDKVQTLLQGGLERPEKKCSDEDKAAYISCPNHVVEWIQQIYGKREGVIFPVPWCEDFSFQLEDIFTRLKIVAKGRTRGEVTKEITSMTSIFTPHEHCKQPLVVLIEGEPGMGKTTYCQKLAYDWATKQDREWDESFPRIEVLLLLRCREIQSSIWEAIDEQILPEDIDPEATKRFFQFLRENPSKVLLVLDGLDEADPGKLKLILKLIQKEKLPGSFIVVTSRLEVRSKIRGYTDTVLEIVGFTTADAKCFVRKYFQHSEHLAETLIAELDSKNLNELTRNPLNTLLLCVIFEDFNGVFPKSRTQLYIEIVLFVLRRYESKNGLSSSCKDLLMVYKKELMTLGKMALDSLRKEELYFEDDRSDFKQSLIVKFGFLSIEAGGRKRAPCHRYGFFHKSFQEFFAALFLAFSIIDGAMDCSSIVNDERYMEELSEVFTFMTEIVATRDAETAESIVHSIASMINVSDCTSDEYHLLLFFALYFIDECKTCAENLYKKLAYAFGESLDLVDMLLPESFSFGDAGYLINTLFLALTVNSTVVILNCEETLFSVKRANSLSQALRENTSISTLLLSNSKLRDEEANCLFQALRVNTSLTTLDLSHNSVSCEGAYCLSQALRVNTSLTSLDLSGNSIGAYGAYYLSQALRVNTSLTTLRLSNNHISSKVVSFLTMTANRQATLDLPRNSQALRENTSRAALDSSGNLDVGEGASSLAQALKVNTSLSTLDLSGNLIRDEGVNSLSQVLRENTSLTTLDLSGNCIDDKGASCLAQALRVNTSLTTLNLSNNEIVEEGVHSLSQALVVNNSLTTLDLSLNVITFEAVRSLSLALTDNSSIICLHLSPMFSKRRDSEVTTLPYLNPRIKISWPWEL
ncbi:PREDICTED: protein NLRC3-like [Acropora digitifera]|uniref:protein NLRC3-like n=1 Tax=Acropora digitifera TaxID=70779 RepID=UPI00077AB953|nr:PREDICTED: protein NLRC3-like [Acropora digitifera]